ncbi:lipoprotein [Listeria kieliensis]
MKKGLFLSVILILCLVLTACGEKEYGGVKVDPNYYDNLIEFEKKGQKLYTLISTFNSNKDGTETINKIVNTANDLIKTTNDSLKEKDKKELVELQIRGKSVSLIGIPKNALKYSRDISEIERKIINDNFKSLCGVESKKNTLTKAEQKKINNYLQNKIGIEKDITID